MTTLLTQKPPALTKAPAPKVRPTLTKLSAPKTRPTLTQLRELRLLGRI